MQLFYFILLSLFRFLAVAEHSIFLGYYTVYSPPSCDLSCPSAYTVAFHLISNQMFPVFTGIFYLDFNFCIQSVNIGARPEYAPVSLRLRIQDRPSLMSPFPDVLPNHRIPPPVPASPCNRTPDSIHGNTPGQSFSERSREAV